MPSNDHLPCNSTGTWDLLHSKWRCGKDCENASPQQLATADLAAEISCEDDFAFIARQDTLGPAAQTAMRHSSERLGRLGISLA